MNSVEMEGEDAEGHRYEKEQEAKVVEPRKDKLTNEEITRYSRQLILPEIGPEGQKGLKQGAVLIVGVGGLGCPAAMYLTSAGVGTLGLVDYDVVELSNLHRQIIHSEKTINMLKAESAKLFLQSLNSNVNIITFKEPFTNTNALEIIRQFDVVIDCTDNVPTRYLLNDACVLEKKPLVSGSAVGCEGQLTVYSQRDCPCYRCLFPEPPPVDSVANCSDGGVIGAVPGLIGTLQALETIKMLTGIPSSYEGKMLLFDGWTGSFRTVKLRGQQRYCTICSPKNKNRMAKLLDNYQEFCGTCSIDDKDKGIALLDEKDRITPQEYHRILGPNTESGRDNDQLFLLIDVRESRELEICTLPNTSFNIPYSDMNRSDRTFLMDNLQEYLLQNSKKYQESKKSAVKLPVFVVCRRGNDSQRAVKLIKGKWPDLAIDVKDIQGGLHQWQKDVDNNFPIY